MQFFSTKKPGKMQQKQPEVPKKYSVVDIPARKEMQTAERRRNVKEQKY